jgi:uncharacterized protein YndB with AHSA1/START domain
MTQTAEGTTMSQATETNVIEKEIVLRAPRSRVWRALSNAEEFGQWFGMKFDGTFKAGQLIRGKFSNPKYVHLTLELTVESIEPERLFSYRWHPGAMDPNVDYSQEPTTLIEFHLSETADGTKLTVIESGFDQIPEWRRAEAFRMNNGGWTSQVENIRKYVES